MVGGLRRPPTGWGPVRLRGRPRNGKSPLEGAGLVTGLAALLDQRGNGWRPSSTPNGMGSGSFARTSAQWEIASRGGGSRDGPGGPPRPAREWWAALLDHQRDGVRFVCADVRAMGNRLSRGRVS